MCFSPWSSRAPFVGAFGAVLWVAKSCWTPCSLMVQSNLQRHKDVTCNVRRKGAFCVMLKKKRYSQINNIRCTNSNRFRCGVVKPNVSEFFVKHQL